MSHHGTCMGPIRPNTIATWAPHDTCMGPIRPNTIATCTEPLINAYIWWRHQIETFSTLLAICAGTLPVPGEFPAQKPVTRSFGGFFDLRLNKRLSKQSWNWWYETPSWSLWRHCNAPRACLASVLLVSKWRPGAKFIWAAISSPRVTVGCCNNIKCTGRNSFSSFTLPF